MTSGLERPTLCQLSYVREWVRVEPPTANNTLHR